MCPVSNLASTVDFLLLFMMTTAGFENDNQELSGRKSLAFTMTIIGHYSNNHGTRFSKLTSASLFSKAPRVPQRDPSLPTMVAIEIRRRLRLVFHEDFH